MKQVTTKPAVHVAIYPGSFDPITNGHLDRIERGAKLVDKLVVAILQNDAKQPLFTIEERMEMLGEVVGLRRAEECNGNLARHQGDLRQ